MTALALALIGGGLQNGLIALATLAARPSARIALFERGPTLGGNHLWLLTFTFMGWKGKFRRQDAWRARFAAEGLAVKDVVELGREGRLFPDNVLFVLEAAPHAAHATSVSV